MKQGYILTVNTKTIVTLYSSNVFINEYEIKEFESNICNFINALKNGETFINFMEFYVGKENYQKLIEFMDFYEDNNGEEFTKQFKDLVFKYTNYTLADNVFFALSDFNNWFNISTYALLGVTYDKVYVTTHKIDIYE